jgi:hypothetical protein
MAAHLPRLNTRVLTVFLLVSIPGLVVGVALVLALADARLSDGYGQHLQDLARQTAADVDEYVYRRILDVTLLARTPDVRSDAAAASAKPPGGPAPESIDEEWTRTTKPPAAVTAAMNSAASKYLRDIVAHDRIYRELLLTDNSGRLIAASNIPSDYYQGDEDWWRSAHDDGRHGTVSLSDVRWDKSAGVYAIEIAVPVPAPDGDQLVGILKAVTDSREMLASLGSLRLGTTGEAWLVRPNGSIVFGPDAPQPGATFWAADPLRKRGDVLAKGGPTGGTFFEAQAPDGAKHVVGVAQSQLSSSYPGLTWIVAVSQARDELLAPVRVIGWYLLLLFALAALVVIGLALWFSIRLAAPQVDIDMHLVDHPEVSHVG